MTFSARITVSVNPGQNGFLGITHDVSRADRPSAPPCRARLVLVLLLVSLYQCINPVHVAVHVAKVKTEPTWGDR